jgi:hypothetical protein
MIVAVRHRHIAVTEPQRLLDAPSPALRRRFESQTGGVDFTRDRCPAGPQTGRGLY